ncbi:hypothetical protein NA619_23670, partial [Pseudomonas stutzeri]|nr:hypothetical protein [Stutzerimonas stutzeri]
MILLGDFEEKVTGTKRDRPELDRLARSMSDLLHIAERLKSIRAGLRSLAEPWASAPSESQNRHYLLFAIATGKRPAKSPSKVP